MKVKPRFLWIEKKINKNIMSDVLLLHGLTVMSFFFFSCWLDLTGVHQCGKTPKLNYSFFIYLYFVCSKGENLVDQSFFTFYSFVWQCVNVRVNGVCIDWYWQLSSLFGCRYWHKHNLLYIIYFQSHIPWNRLCSVLFPKLSISSLPSVCLSFIHSSEA